MNCTDMYCSNELTDFDIGKQSLIRQNKYIFCRGCRGGWARGKILFWRCQNCEDIMTSVSNPLHKQYCKKRCRCQAYRKWTAWKRK